MANLEKISFKSYCWSVGTTSFRMKNFNYNIEQQLILLKEFFLIEKNKTEFGIVIVKKTITNFLKIKILLRGMHLILLKMHGKRPLGLKI